MAYFWDIFFAQIWGVGGGQNYSHFAAAGSCVLKVWSFGIPVAGQGFRNREGGKLNILKTIPTPTPNKNG